MCVCVQGQIRLLYDLVYVGLYLSALRSHLLLVFSCLTNKIHDAVQSNSLKRNRSLSCPGKQLSTLKGRALDILQKYFDEPAEHTNNFFKALKSFQTIFGNAKLSIF